MRKVGPRIKKKKKKFVDLPATLEISDESFGNCGKSGQTLGMLLFYKKRVSFTVFFLVV